MASSPYLRTTPANAPRPSWRELQRPVGTSFLVHGGFAATAWALGTATNRLDYKDLVWPAAPVANAWYQAVGIPVLQYGLPLSVALRGLSWRQSLLLGGVTVWGTRLLYQIGSHVLTRNRDDERYTKRKLERGYWTKSLLTVFVPEALFQALITLPVVAPFRSTRVALATWGWTDIVAVALFGIGTTLEVTADAQKRAAAQRGLKGLYTQGVWSIVRHPNYLGDALTQLSFALLSVNTPAFHPAIFVGPAANYFFLRFIGGDAESEPAQEERYSQFDPAKDAQLKRYKQTTNAFWPALSEFSNVWTWVVLAAGAGAVVVEKVAREAIKPSLL